MLALPLRLKQWRASFQFRKAWPVGDNELALAVTERQRNDILSGLEDSDMEIQTNNDQLKEIIKAALVEVLEERQELLRDAIEQALEDLALARAIEEGNETELITRSEVFGILEG